MSILLNIHVCKLNQWLENKCKLQHQIGIIRILFIDSWHTSKQTPNFKQRVKELQNILSFVNQLIYNYNATSCYLQLYGIIMRLKNCNHIIFNMYMLPIPQLGQVSHYMLHRSRLGQVQHHMLFKYRLDQVPHYMLPRSMPSTTLMLLRSRCHMAQPQA